MDENISIQRSIDDQLNDAVDNTSIQVYMMRFNFGTFLC